MRSSPRFGFFDWRWEIATRSVSEDPRFFLVGVSSHDETAEWAAKVFELRKHFGSNNGLPPITTQSVESSITNGTSLSSSEVWRRLAKVRLMRTFATCQA
jgi:hypothetical protein